MDSKPPLWFTHLYTKEKVYRGVDLRKEKNKGAFVFLRDCLHMLVLSERICTIAKSQFSLTGKKKVSWNPAVILAFGVVAFVLGVMVGFVSRVLAEAMGLKSVDGENNE